MPEPLPPPTKCQVYFTDADNVNDGDLFIAKIRSVEGRTVIDLLPVCKLCKLPSHETKGRRAICDECRAESL